MIFNDTLMVVMGVRWFNITRYWIDKINFIDKLLIKYYPHDKAHEKAYEYFKDHGYKWLLIYAEDVISTPDHIKLLAEDIEKYNLEVVSGWCNWDFTIDWTNISKNTNLINQIIYSPYQYMFIPLKSSEVLYFEDPIVKVFFVGLPLTFIHRDVLHRIGGIKPYTYIKDNILGRTMTRGIMHDLQFAIDCYKNNIPIYVDLRCGLLHFGDTRKFINIANKNPEVEFIPAHNKNI